MDDETEKKGQKACGLCGARRDVLVRCQTDASGAWRFVCVGACWRRVGGGRVDGDGAPEHAHYRYGGMWKNKHAGASARMPRRVKQRQRELRARDEMAKGQEAPEQTVDEQAT